MGLTEQIPDDDPELKLYTVAQVAELFEVTAQSVRNWIINGDLKALRLNNQFRIKRKDLLTFLNERLSSG